MAKAVPAMHRFLKNIIRYFKNSTFYIISYLLFKRLVDHKLTRILYDT